MENTEDFGFLEDLLSGSERELIKKERERSVLRKGIQVEEKIEKESDVSPMDLLEFEDEDKMVEDLMKKRTSSSIDSSQKVKNHKEKISSPIDRIKSTREREEMNNSKGFSIVSEIIEDDVEDEHDFKAIQEDNYDDFYDDLEEEIAKLSPAMRKALEWEPPAPKSTEDSLVNEWIQTGWVGFLHIDQILTEAIITGASDVHIAADLKISMTRNGDIVRYNNYAIPDDETLHTLVHDGLLSHQQQQILNTEYEYEGAYVLMYGPFRGRRTRLTIGKTFGKYFLVFRIISEYIPKLKDLDIEQELVNWSYYANGLFLLCGPTGSGKSTTLASILHNLQMTTRKKIISVEKPIEYVYPDDAPSLVVQREVGEDTRGFYEGLTSAMRQSPNVILLGEVRNTEEVTELLRAAETGHLAISTMHTNSVPTTINRIQNLFSGNEQRRIMSTLADTMRGIGNQVLVKTVDGKGRFAVRELLTINEEIKKLIIEGDIQGIRQYQIKNKATMEHNLVRAVKAGKCTYEDALGQSADPELFNKLMNEKD